MDEVVFDFEGDGLHPTKIHVVSYSRNGGDITSLYENEDIRKLFLTDNDNTYFIGHNITRFDIPHLERLLDIEIPKHRLVDTLALSWYLYPTRLKHGLEFWGEDVGVAKPHIEDWYNQSQEVYTHRCESDVKINQIIWDKFKRRLMEIYLKQDKADALLRYLRFKMNCAAIAEKTKWKVDIELAEKNLKTLIEIRQDKFEELEQAMPLVSVYRTKLYPKRYYKQDGSLTSHAIEWERLCEELGIDRLSTSLEYVFSKDAPNPSSHTQLKQWLFSLGWKPRTFKTNPKGEEVPQLNVLDPDKKGELCSSVAVLAEKEPAINSLAGLFVLNHRISLLQGILDNVDDEGYIKAEIAGLTNTLRFKHSVVVNLPGVNKPYGEYIRCVLIANEGEVLCGSDQASLEDRTKQHFMFDYDPDYVNEMNTPGFDPHLDIGVLGGMMTKEEADEYKELKKNKQPTPKHLDIIRHNAKTTNYSCTYGAFPPKIARSAGITIDEAEALWETYWSRNWAIKKIAENTYVKELEDGSLWLFNPVSQLFYSLRHHKDKFSTLNQGTGAYCFDVWIGFVLSKYPKITAQFHDEGVWSIKKGEEEWFRSILLNSLEEANDYLKLNRQLDIGINFGENYGQIH